MVLAITVPSQAIADALGDLGNGVRVVVWDPSAGDAAPDHADEIALVCIPHYSGGRRLYGRVAALPNVRVIQIPSAGYEHALPFVPQGVALANARGVHDTRTAEFAIALALASQRLLDRFIRAQDRGDWAPEYFTPSLADRRALVVGYGSIGAAIGSRLRAMEVEVRGVARSARTAPDGTAVHAASELPSLLPEAEIVFLVTPFDETTDKLADAAFFAAMPDGALFVNVGRGACADTEALVAECASGRLRAALDVIDPEPLPADHPAWTTPGMIIAPHVGGATPLTDRRYVSLVRAQAAALAEGRDPVNLVARGPSAV
jgi:phosphoglycerate dehydrogenase-like enzyme